MKPLLFFATCLFLSGLLFIASCEKDKTTDKPIAKAGVDQLLTTQTCDAKVALVVLDGSGSYDPNNNIVGYIWKVISATGSQTATFTNMSSVKASMADASIGDYVIELTVTDAEGLFSKDTILIAIKAISEEFDFDITSISTFVFKEDSLLDNWYYYNVYYDITSISGTGNFQPLGDFSIDISEFADTVDVVDTHGTHLSVRNVISNNTKYLFGDCSVNFKKLIKAGGGPINGTVAVTDGSALACNPNAFTNFPPLTITGNLDTATKIVNLRIQGKVFF